MKEAGNVVAGELARDVVSAVICRGRGEIRVKGYHLTWPSVHTFRAVRFVSKYLMLYRYVLSGMMSPPPPPQLIGYFQPHTCCPLQPISASLPPTQFHTCAVL